ncbi:heavy metal-associated isoprenylated plant protein 39-like isoform X4 [Rhodamnia argentea]|uniref:Heavy metal-associated isoprenylated plant protein 39-like isoform X4 n=1 Tax=Rhodamnia argentea TaxID=178133 RepID=A0ABM3H5D2_9MYRT|nr:heavy metal-associated isoprenylated plant protein 39-like isoform X4 [Rhodamnia argentea]
MKLVLKVEVHDHKAKSKVMQAVSGFEGIGSLTMDMQAKKLTVSGDFDPVKVVNKLRKSWHTEILSVGPAKEDDGKKDEGKKNEDIVKAFQTYYSPPLTYYYVPPYEETPGCVIC